MAAKETVARVLVVLAAAYPRQNLPKETSQVYAELLCDIDDELLVVAAKQHAASSKWFPSVAELRSMALEIQARANGLPTAAGAWCEVMDQVRAHGYYGAPCFSHRLVGQAVDGLGGWRALCASTNQVADRAHFMRIYETLSKREQDSAAMLPEVRAAMQILAENRRRPSSLPPARRVGIERGF